MKLLIDQNVTPEVAALLRELGHEAIHTSELGKQTEEDPDLIVFASQSNMVVVTRDRDFHQIIATRSLLGPSAILLRLSDLAPETSARTVDFICHRYPEKLSAGCLITANGRSIRTRSLPLNRA